MGERGAEVGALSGSANATEFVSGIHSVGSVMYTADKAPYGGYQVLPVTMY